MGPHPGLFAISQLRAAAEVESETGGRAELDASEESHEARAGRGGPAGETAGGATVGKGDAGKEAAGGGATVKETVGGGAGEKPEGSTWPLPPPSPPRPPPTP
jgi:hypothetical protein